MRVKCAVNNKNAHLHYSTWFVVSLLVLVGIAITFNAVAAVVPTAYTPATSFLTQQVGWQQPQQEARLASAQQAFSNDEYYLSHRLLEPLAVQGNVSAQYQLAMLYDSSRNLESAAARAAYWYKKAAKQGHQDAEHNLAVAYANGDGVAQDMGKAIRWWQQAAATGHVDAQYNLGVIYATGKDGVERNLAKAVKWWRQAAIAGDAMAQYNLAALYANGVESVRSYCEATRWWEKSAANGFSQANIALQMIKLKQDYHSCW